MSQTINVANRTIFCRDNLDILRQINSACVDLIYLDPPFNKNKRFTAPIGSKAEGASFDDIFRREAVKDEWLLLIEHKHKDIFDFINAVKGISRGDYNWCYLTYMAVRLLECHRVLKPTGSLYLHCDPTMSHYLKVLLDCIFGEANFHNEVVWRRYQSSHNDASRRYGRIHDIILFYGKKPKKYIWTNEAREPYSQAYLETSYKNKDETGRYTTAPLHARKLQGGGYSFKWRGIVDIWRFTKSRLDELDAKGLIHWPKKSGGKPRKKVYLDEDRGVPASDMFLDIELDDKSQATGYPTQKPLDLLKRIIKASSNPGDMVLDPFCGCATTCVAAEYLERHWIGIDISLKAYELVNDRLNNSQHQLGLSGKAWKFKGKTIQRTDIPARTDTPPKPKHSYNQMKRILHKEQNGKCALCKTAFEERHLEIDHFYPKVLGGVDDIENRQLLCGSCNRIKGDKSMEEAIAIARKRGLIQTG